MVKICWTGLLTLNFEIIPKNAFSGFPKISAGHRWSWKFFFANFQILGPLGCQGWVVIPQNVKKGQNHCTVHPDPDPDPDPGFKIWIWWSGTRINKFDYTCTVQQWYKLSRVVLNCQLRPALLPMICFGNNVQDKVKPVNMTSLLHVCGIISSSYA